MAFKAKLMGCCSCGGNCSLECRTRPYSECCSNSGVISFTKTVTGTAQDNIDYPFARDDPIHWDFTLTPVGPGVLPNTTSYSCAAHASSGSGPVPYIVVVGGVSFTNG